MSNNRRDTIFPAGDDFWEPAKTVVLRSMTTHISNPWKDFVRIERKQEAGTVEIAMSSRTNKVFAIREITGTNKNVLRDLKIVSHPHLVAYTSAYHHEDNLYLVCEGLLTPLQQIIATPRGRIEWSEVVTIAAGLLKALDFLHNRLGLAHGDVRSENVIVSNTGQVKLAKVGECLLRRPETSMADDMRGLSIVLRDSLEPEMAVLDPDTSTLRRPADDVQAFLTELSEMNPTNALKHHLLQDAPGDLIPYVLVANEVGSKDVYIYPRTATV